MLYILKMRDTERWWEQRTARRGTENLAMRKNR